MIQLQHKKLLVDSCYPRDEAERLKLWSDIKPIKYGNEVFWQAATTYALAQYQVPDEAAYHVVLRVECYVVNLNAGATDYGQFEPPPPGTAFWQYVPYGAGATYNVTGAAIPSHKMLDVDEFLFFKGGYVLTLTGNLNATADGATRLLRTVVYGYNIGAMVADKLGAFESETPLQ